MGAGFDDCAADCLSALQDGHGDAVPLGGVMADMVMTLQTQSRNLRDWRKAKRD
jgi:hypothetical protein